jgi:hypothetical protein
LVVGVVDGYVFRKSNPEVTHPADGAIMIPMVFWEEMRVPRKSTVVDSNEVTITVVDGNREITAVYFVHATFHALLDWDEG